MDGSGYYRDGTPATLPEEKSPWRWFPWAVAGVLFFVAVVNFTMMYFAVITFPGDATEHDFSLSNRYNHVLAEAARQQRLGWTLAADVAGARPVLTMTTKSGAPLRGMVITATAARPLGPRHAIPLLFRETTPGRYLASAALTLPGVWNLAITADGHGTRYLATRRVIVP